MRCKHANLCITETGTWYTAHVRENGKWWHNNEPGAYSNLLQVECYDCGLKRTYYRYAKNLPKWVAKAVEEFLDRDNGE